MNGDNLIGNVVNERYEIIEVVGNGGMATVYKANDRLLDRNVAVKILKDSLKEDSEIVEKFSAEGKAAAALSHNNIVSVYDVGTIDGLSYIIMEYVEGQTLKEYINQNKPIKWQTACEIAIQIADALNTAHEHGIIHRDIKPHNILITKDCIAKVADFGIASAVSSDTMVAGGSALGSVHYISPEQARGGYVDTTSDLYSLGVVLYEMLTGVLPFDGDNAVSIALKKLEEEPVSPKVINLDIPQALDAMVMKAISKEQHIRYKTALELSADLKELLNEDSLHIITNKNELSDDENSRKKKRKTFNPIIASIVLAAVIAVTVFAVMTAGSKEYIVPDLRNKTLEEALALVFDTEFTIDEDSILYEVSEEIEEGLIISQNPGANQSVKKNKKIQLTISSGDTEGNILVPKVIDITYDEAKAILESKGLQYQVIEEEGIEEDLNYVMRQSPKEGEKVTEGYKVILHVCTTVIGAEEKIKVPDLMYLTRAEAEKELAEFGLTIGNTTKRQTTEFENGKIMEQNPPANTEVDKNTAIDIVISDTSVATPTPEVTQQPESTPETTPAATPASTPTQAPVVTNQPQNTPVVTQQPEMKRKNLTIHIPDTAGETVNVKVFANGKEIHNKTHQKSEGKVDIAVQSNKDAEVEVYMDNELVVRKVIEFN